jgi:FkbM family methyltransferase
MSLSSKIRLEAIRLSGYFIYKKKDLPVGIDLASDLKNKFNIKVECVFDVGANYGQTALHYFEEFPKVSIYSFEPVAASFKKLEENTKGKDSIKCFHFALGDKEEELEISLFDEANSQLNSLKSSNSGSGGKKEKIKVRTLDGFVLENNIREIDLLKIDTEGFEINVLNGAKKMLAEKKVNAVLCETALAKSNKRNTQLVELMELLEEKNYFFVGLYETNVNHYKEGLAYSNALFIKK